MKDTLTHYLAPLRRTPFHPRQQALNRLNRWGAWAGCTTPLCYGDEAMEHTAIRNAASLYDLCPMVKYSIAGPDAGAYLNRLTVRDAAKMTPGGVQYTVWCDDAGMVLDDGTVFRLSPDEFRLCCQERHLPWLIDSAAGFDVTVADVTDDIAALSLQGPCSASVLAAAGFDVSGLKPFRMASFPFANDTVSISRTGFTGDLGYELWMQPWAALAVWDALMAAGGPFGIRPVGSDALNIARLEAGFLTTNVDFIPAHQALREDRARSPLELGLGWLIDWQKGPFTGRRALQAERDGRTSRWALVGLDVGGNVEAGGSLLYHRKDREAGFVTAACWSPATKRNIALAQVEARHAAVQDLWVEIYALRELQYVKLMVPVRLAERPFFVHPRRRATPPERF
jgi:aminomethyltransferase